MTLHRSSCVSSNNAAAHGTNASSAASSSADATRTLHLGRQRAQPPSGSRAAHICKAVSAPDAGGDILPLERTEPGSPSVDEALEPQLPAIHRPDATEPGAAGPESSSEAEPRSTPSQAPTSSQQSAHIGSPAAASAPQPADAGAQISARQPEAPGGERGDPCPYKQGDVVLGRVKWAGPRGARIQLQGCPGEACVAAILCMAARQAFARMFTCPHFASQ